MADGSKISQQRTKLHTALQGRWPRRRGVCIAPHRSTRLRRACGSARTSRTLDNVVIRISFPVVAVYDGADHRQVEALDDLGAVMSDAIFRAGGRPIAVAARRLDVGGPTLRSVEYQADFTAQGITLCLPLLEVDDV